MRGKVSVSFAKLVRWRITPAYAGKSCNRFCTSGSGWDHPRLCGEKFILTAVVFAQTGSPPPMRGKGFTSDLPNK